MKKSSLAAALLIAFAGTASAQSNVTIYGLLDVGLASVSNATASTSTATGVAPYSNGNEFKMTSGIQQGSRLGFKGTEELAPGLSAVFLLESGILFDTGASDQGGTLFGRQAFVGLKSTSLGSITMGNQYAPQYLAWKTIDPMDDGMAANAGSIINTSKIKRVSNSVLYTTPTFAGFTADLIYGLGEVTGLTSGSRNIGGSLIYKEGPITVKLAYNELNNATALDAAKNTLIGGIYDLGMLKLHGTYGTTKGLGTVDSTETLLGMTIPFGPHTILGSYIQKDDKTVANKDASQVGLGYTYSFSKRTNLYTSFAKISNNNGSNYRTLSATAPITGQNGAIGGTQEVNVGIRHIF